jgi:hypothetical protein
MYRTAMRTAHTNLARPVAPNGLRIARHFNMQRLACLRTLELEQNRTAVFGWRGGHLVRLPAADQSFAPHRHDPPIPIMIGAEAAANNMR